MHTTNWEDPETGLEVSAQHNGDYSGDVILNLPAGSLLERRGDEIDVAVPFDLMRSLVAEWLRDLRSEALEEATDSEIFGVKIKGHG